MDIDELREFLQRLNSDADAKRPDIIEKDYHLHRLLYEISKDDYFQQNLIFKGGTCLVKAYVGYFRFSEDLDFKWKDPAIWEGRTSSQTRRECSKQIDNVIEQLVPIAKRLGLEFGGDKSNMGEVIIGAGGRMSRFYMGYHSETMNAPAKIKMEINFVDKIFYPHEPKMLGSYVHGLKFEELKLLFREPWDEYTKPIEIECYDPREIFTEKCRAALTRINYKVRDIIDIHILEKQYGYSIPDFRKEILEKTRFVLDLYSKYQRNVEAKTLPETGDIPNEELTLLTGSPPPDLEDNIPRIHSQIEELQKELIGHDK